MVNICHWFPYSVSPTAAQTGFGVCTLVPLGHRRDNEWVICGLESVTVRGTLERVVYCMGFKVMRNWWIVFGNRLDWSLNKLRLMVSNLKSSSLVLDFEDLLNSQVTLNCLFQDNRNLSHKLRFWRTEQRFLAELICTLQIVSLSLVTEKLQPRDEIETLRAEVNRQSELIVQVSLSKLIACETDSCLL